jgi:prophage regulatory protein
MRRTADSLVFFFIHIKGLFMSSENFMRISDVMQRTRLARSTVWLWVKQGKLPAPIKLSERVTVWRESTLNAWMNEQGVA